MNEHFVSIKVDREERPDLDHIYQSVVQMLSGQGGWPLTMFLTPEQEPFYGGTYFPPEDRYGRPGFPRVLAAVCGSLPPAPGGSHQEYPADPRGPEKTLEYWQPVLVNFRRHSHECGPCSGE